MDIYSICNAETAIIVVYMFISREKTKLDNI